MSDVLDKQAATPSHPRKPLGMRSQITLGPWLEDLQPWLSSYNSSYTLLIENCRAIISQGRCFF
eukprot:6199551-Pleurochrysis_carterae.AAC.3